MADAAVTVAEFYRQLALLLQARLPLPASIQELAKGFADARFKAALTAVGAATLSGQPLSAAMAQHPALFPPLQVRLVAVGERAGVLPSMLAWLARAAATQQQFLRQVRETLVYPLITLGVAGAVLVLLLMVVVPEMARWYSEMLGKSPLPALTYLVIGASNLLMVGWPVLLLPVLAGVGLTVWLLSGSLRAGRMLLTGCGWVPGGGRLLRAWDYAQLCQMLSELVRAGVPAAEGLDLLAGVVLHPRLRRDLPRWAAAVHGGRSMAEVLSEAGGEAALLALAFHPAAEPRLAEALADLGGVFQEQAEAASQGLLARLSVASMVLMVGGSATVVFAMFMPFFRLFYWYDGNI